MTSKGRKRVAGLVAVMIAGALFALLYRPGEGPIYKGRHLSEWVKRLGYRFSSSSEDHFNAEAAVTHAGTNAFPFLLKWIQHEDTFLRYKILAPFQSLMSQRRFMDLATSPAEARADGATQALVILSTNFTPELILELKRLSSDPAAPQTAACATRALAHAGPEGHRHLAAMLQSTGPEGDLAFVRIVEMHINRRLTPAEDIFVPGLIRYMTDTNTPTLVPLTFKSYAGAVLSNLNVFPQDYVAVLTTNLQSSDADVRRCAAHALPSFGAEAAPASSALSRLLSDPDAIVRASATNALRQIAPEALTNAPPQ